MAEVMPPRRKKWTEEEEKTLIEKYGDMVSEGVLVKMKTREKKFRPIAAQLNSLHHARDPDSFPWQWTWKDVSTKVQNMRHQYLLVKQKIKKPTGCGEGFVCDVDQFDWDEGLSHWPNFLRYKDVFGDVVLESNSSVLCRQNGRNAAERKSAARAMVRRGEENRVDDGLDGEDGGKVGLMLEYEGVEGEQENRDHVEEEFSPFELRKKRKRLKGIERRVFGFLASQLSRLENRAAMEEDRARAREERETTQEQLRRQRLCEWEEMERECTARERRRRDEQMAELREWEERMEQRRHEWRKQMEEMISHHRASLNQLQSRILHTQQNIMNQLLGIVSQWLGPSAGMADHTGAGTQYLSQMIHNLHHVNGIVHSESRVGGENHEDQFIVDG